VRAFPLELGRPILRSSLLAGGIGLAMIVATFGLVRSPSPLEATANRLREIAADIEKSSSDPSDLAMAKNARDVASALENPKLPPEEKQKRIEELMKQMAPHGDERGAGGKEKGNGGGSGSGNTPSSAKGNGPGNGNGQGGAGSSNQPGKG